MGRKLDCVARSGQGELLSQNVHWFLVIVAIMSVLHIFRALLTWKLRTAFIAWVDELWQKTSYFILGALLLFDWVSLDAFVPLYIASYGVSFLLMGGASIGLFTGLSKGINRSDLPQFAEFSAFSLFAGGAVIVATQLDYIMVGKFLGLEEVPVYTLGFFMGSVVALPRRATTNIVRGSLPKKSTETTTRASANSARTPHGSTSCSWAPSWRGLGRFRSASAVVAAEIPWTGVGVLVHCRCAADFRLEHQQQQPPRIQCALPTRTTNQFGLGRGHRRHELPLSRGI